MNMEQNKTVLIGMSGGVDSVAAALLLQQEGYTATGCTLRLYDRIDGGCGSSKEAEDARGGHCTGLALLCARRECGFSHLCDGGFYPYLLRGTHP